MKNAEMVAKAYSDKYEKVVFNDYKSIEENLRQAAEQISVWQSHGELGKIQFDYQKDTNGYAAIYMGDVNYETAHRFYDYCVPGEEFTREEWSNLEYSLGSVLVEYCYKDQSDENIFSKDYFAVPPESLNANMTFGILAHFESCEEKNCKY